MNPLDVLERELPGLTRSEQNIARYIIQNPLTVVRDSLTTVAREAKASNTAIIRLCQKLGYQGFSEFKFTLSRAVLSNNGRPQEDNYDPQANSLSSIVSQYTQYLNRMAVETDIDKIRAIAALVCQSGRLAIMGINRTGFSASQFSYRLSKMGVANHLITDEYVMLDYMEILSAGDTCVIFSISTGKYAEIASRLKKNGANLVLFTMTETTPLKKLADHMVCLPRISYDKRMNFLDDQAIFFVFIEAVLSEVAAILNQAD